ncbi:MAG TPA: hypothetical protein VM802_05860 [Chitinophaga sp.]|uniref:hypothetical protein n=1 Tax=Chitinophaga sp. TaxID=1869181 RepID=UPI002BD7C7B4|nr:hypothetical protein [Chitinophaga sp.]HVI44370.1 hypothetical protein [Chitinophaga sp.]
MNQKNQILSLLSAVVMLTTSCLKSPLEKPDVCSDPCRIAQLNFTGISSGSHNIFTRYYDARGWLAAISARMGFPGSFGDYQLDVKYAGSYVFFIQQNSTDTAMKLLLDPFLRPLSYTTGAAFEHQRARYYYNYDGTLKKIISEFNAGNGPTQDTTSYRYDWYGNVLSVAITSPNVGRMDVVYTYDYTKPVAGIYYEPFISTYMQPRLLLEYAGFVNVQPVHAIRSYVFYNSGYPVISLDYYNYAADNNQLITGYTAGFWGKYSLQWNCDDRQKTVKY